MLPIFAGIGEILLLGAVVYWEFGRSASQPSPAVMIAQSIGRPSPAARQIPSHLASGHAELFCGECGRAGYRGA